jgi:DNA-binding IclR family transcriptional regulator
MVGALFLACPVFDAHEAVCGSVSAGVPKPRYSAELGKKIAEHLKAVCHAFSRWQSPNRKMSDRKISTE